MQIDPTQQAARARRLPAEHSPVPPARVGVLLVNLGTPDAPTSASVRAYLAEFLSDRRIVDYPRALWLPILHGIILNVRPAKTAENYRKIWSAATNESPLRLYTRRAAERLGGRLTGAHVDWAMRYGSPSISDRIAAMKDAGCERILVIPLYPQYSATTTASVHDAVFRGLESLVWQPAIRIAAPYHDDLAYIEALARSLRGSLERLSFSPERVILSFHGIPQRYFEAGDPYHCHCMKTARLLRERLGWSETFAPVAFQSRFGREPWLEPATDSMIGDLAASGVTSVAVATPGFAADCIETLEEIAIAGRETFEENGGRNFAALPCLNDSDEMIDLLLSLVSREAAGWIDP